MFFYFVVQLTALAEFDQQIDVFGVVEIAVERRNVPMTQIELNTELSDYLINIIFFSDYFFCHYLHCTEETCLFMPDDHDLAILSFP